MMWYFWLRLLVALLTFIIGLSAARLFGAPLAPSFLDERRQRGSLVPPPLPHAPPAPLQPLAHSPCRTHEPRLIHPFFVQDEEGRMLEVRVERPAVPPPPPAPHERARSRR